MNLDLLKQAFRQKIGKVVVIGGDTAPTACARLRLEQTRPPVPAHGGKCPGHRPQMAEEEGAKYGSWPNRASSPAKMTAGEVECIRMELGEPDAGRRRRLIPIEAQFTVSRYSAGVGHWPTRSSARPPKEHGQVGLIFADARPGQLPGGFSWR
jgi:hypothetical protein